MKLSQLMNKIELFYPKDLAEDWDNVGLLIGDERTEVTRILTTLEITEDVIEEAIERKAELIISHHPIIFKPIKDLNFKNPHNRLIRQLITNDIAVYCMHTNVDVASNGMNDWLANILELENTSILDPTKVYNFKKIAVEIKEDQMNKVIDLFKKVGVGQRNRYIENVNISPKIKYAKKFNEEEIEENILVIEGLISEEYIKEIKNELYLNKIHTYEITNIENATNVYGLGRVGYVKTQSLEQIANSLIKLYALDHVKIVGNREKEITKVAIVCGSGSGQIDIAKQKGCDLIITGDVGFHDAHNALMKNIAIIDPGHNIEIIFNDIMADFINLFEDITAFPSEIDTNPFEVIS